MSSLVTLLNEADLTGWTCVLFRVSYSCEDNTGAWSPHLDNSQGSKFPKNAFKACSAMPYRGRISRGFIHLV